MRYYKKKAIHKQNEFVITHPNAYHEGVNGGLNFAEAINFLNASYYKIAENGEIPHQPCTGKETIDEQINHLLDVIKLNLNIE